MQLVSGNSMCMGCAQKQGRKEGKEESWEEGKKRTTSLERM